MVQKGQVVLEKIMTLLAATSWSTVSMGEEVMGAMVAKLLLNCSRELRTGKLTAERSGIKTSYHSFEVQTDWTYTSIQCVLCYQDGN